MNPNKNQSRNLRSNQTSAERILWDRLRNRQFCNLKFRRQHNIENFIVDFYCEKINLIIELDGDVHGYRKKIEKDQLREKLLIDKGFNIIRYNNGDIYDNLDNVMHDLLLKYQQLGK